MAASTAIAMLALAAVPSYADNKAGEAAFDRGDYLEAQRQWLAEAEKGDTTAQYNLATLLRLGKAGAPDPAGAAMWYERAAEQGHRRAQVNLGRLYLEGAGLPQDYGQALRWFERASDGGYSPGQYYLALIYRDGLGVDRNEGEALRLLQRAANQGLTDAAYALGELYQAGGEKFSANNEQALKWFAAAALDGHRRAQLALARAYETGSDIPADPARAAFWYGLAGDAGDAEAAAASDRLKVGLGAEQQVTLDRLQGMWSERQQKRAASNQTEAGQTGTGR